MSFLRTLQPKITNFALWDFKNFFLENAQPDHDFLAMMNPCQAPEVLVGGERPTLFSDIWALGATVLQWLLETPPWNFQELCSRYKYRENKQVILLDLRWIMMDSDGFLLFQVLALREAMNNKEEPSVLQFINDDENQELIFMLDTFNYEVAFYLILRLWLFLVWPKYLCQKCL